MVKKGELAIDYTVMPLEVHNFIRENGYKLIGKHHEIYLSDPRKTAPQKLKTVLRQPIGKK